MRILHIIHGLEIGGAERQLVTLVDSMRRHGVDQRVGLLQKRGCLADEVEQLSVPVVEFRFRHRALVPSFGRLVRYLRSERIDVLHAHLHLPSIYARLAALRAGTPVRVWTEHSEVADRDLLSRLVERLLVPATDLKVTVSREQAEQTVRLEGFPRDRILTLNNSVPVDAFVDDPRARAAIREECGFASDDVVLTTLSNLHARKRVDEVIRAAARLRDAGVRFRLMIAGDGVDRAALERLAGSLDLHDRVRFLGARTDVAAVLQGADILVSASRWEGLPISMLEALASGVPIVATDVGAVGELLRASGGGFVVEVDDPQQLDTPIRRLIEDHLSRREMGTSGRNYVRQHHSDARNAEQLLELYGTILRRRRQVTG